MKIAVPIGDGLTQRTGRNVWPEQYYSDLGYQSIKKLTITTWLVKSLREVQKSEWSEKNRKLKFALQNTGGVSQVNSMIKLIEETHVVKRATELLQMNRWRNTSVKSVCIMETSTAVYVGEKHKQPSTCYVTLKLWNGEDKAYLGNRKGTEEIVLTLA